MEKRSKKELIEYIEQQEAKNAEYRKRFRDLVAAYKGLQKEKAALENSLEALSKGLGQNESSALSADSSRDCGEENAQKSQGDGPAALEKSEKTNEESSSDRIDALRQALLTLTQEKNRNEGSFLADKKKLKQEHDELKAKLEERENEFEQEKAQLQKTVKELRSDICKEQQQRHEDHSQQALMMRELQSKLITERANREKFEQQYEALLLQQKTSKASSGSQSQRSVEEYEKMVEELTKEMSKLKKMHQEAIEKAQRPNPMLLKLQSEMKDIKSKHQEAVADEQRQSNHAKAELRSLALSSETRITSLEAKVAELSQMIGNYDRLRTQDQNSIQKLKERIAQLDLEKNILLQQQANNNRDTNEEKEDSNLDVHVLADKITKLKDLLYLANQRSQNPLNTHVLLRLQESPVHEGDVHSRCKQELEQLKDEFENYKNRSQTVLKSKAAKDQENHGEIDALRRQVMDLKGRLHACRARCDQQVKSLEEKIQTLQHEHRQQLRQLHSQLESDHMAKILEMEQQMQKQRERTLALLKEKEQELDQKEKQLASLKTGLVFPAFQEKENSFAGSSEREEEISRALDAQDSLPELLSQSMTSSSGDHLILHYVQDIARKDVEIGNLRRARHQAELALRELQNDTRTKEQGYRDDLETLQAKIYRLESSQSEEGVNMEYLKNVVLRYVMCKDFEGKKRILNAIAAVLHFTVRELELARMGL